MGDFLHSSLIEKIIGLVGSVFLPEFTEEALARHYDISLQTAEKLKAFMKERGVSTLSQQFIKEASAKSLINGRESCLLLARVVVRKH